MEEKDQRLDRCDSVLLSGSFALPVDYAFDSRNPVAGVAGLREQSHAVMDGG